MQQETSELQAELSLKKETELLLREQCSALMQEKARIATEFDSFRAENLRLVSELNLSLANLRADHLKEQSALRADKEQLSNNLLSHQKCISGLEAELIEVRKDLTAALKAKRDIASQFDTLSALKISSDREMEEKLSLLRRQLLQAQQQLEIFKAQSESNASNAEPSTSHLSRQFDRKESAASTIVEPGDSSGVIDNAEPDPGLRIR